MTDPASAPVRETLELPGDVVLAADRWLPGGPPRGTIVMLHGGGQTRHAWRDSGARFAHHGWVAYAIDARGHGHSGWSPEGDYTLDAHVSDLASVIGHLGVRPVLVGASMGGMTSLTALGEMVVAAEALVLVDVAPRTEPAGVTRIIEFMRSHQDGFASLEEVAASIHAYSPRPDARFDPEGLRKNVRQHENGRWYWHWDPAFLRPENDPRRDKDRDRLYAAARRVTVPTLLVRGTTSDVVSQAGADELRELIPGAAVRRVTAGHMVAGDNNDVFAEQVIQFLDNELP